MKRWWEEAACLGVDTELFFPDGKKGRSRKDYKDLPDVVWKFCARCPVRKECLEDALKMATLDRYTTTFGIWGGTTVTMRREIIKRKRKIKTE